MRRLPVVAILLALVLVAAPALASAPWPKVTERDDAERHAIGRLAAALRQDGLKVERTTHLYAGVCPQLLPRRRADAYTILVSSSRACDVALRREKTLSHVQGSTWIFASRFDNILLLYVVQDQKMTDKSQALVGFLEVFAVIDA
ncbi:MAG: hypothetical protein M3Q31_15475 [Actinomycetota bacterium]|nr:hypothetical protein [Actinomycetota bacterium]